MGLLGRELDMLRELDDQELARLDGITAREGYAPGQAIVTQQQPVRAIYAILSGSVRVTAVMADADEHLGADEEMLVRLGRGEVFGELSFVTGDPPSLSVIAEEPTEVAAIDSGELRRLIGSDAELCRKLMFGITRTMVGRLKATGRELVLTRYFLRG